MQGIKGLYLFQGLFPAVTLFTERTSKLLGVGSMTLSTLTPVQVFDAHLFLQVLLQARLVSELTKTVGTLERSVVTVVGRLRMIVEKPLLGKVLAAIGANEGPLTGVNTVVNVEVGFAGVGLGADRTNKRFFTGVHTDVLLQRVVVVAGLVTERTHEVGGPGVGRHVRAQR